MHKHFITGFICQVVKVVSYFRASVPAKTITIATGSSSSSGEPHVLSSEQFETLVAAVTTGGSIIQSTVDKKFAEFGKGLQQEHEMIVERVAKKAKLEKPHVFRFKGNEDQYVFNENVADSLDERWKKSEVVKALLILKVLVAGYWPFYSYLLSYTWVLKGTCKLRNK